jgi:hypothetical protein
LKIAVSEHHQPVTVDPEPVITWETRPAPALEFTINFGIFTGREASRRELERLSHAVLPLVSRLSISSEQRFEIGTDAWVTLHLVRVEIENDALPADEPDIEALRAKIAGTLKAWLERCLTEVSGQELTDAEVLASEAVVEGVLQSPADD